MATFNVAKQYHERLFCRYKKDTSKSCEYCSEELRDDYLVPLLEEAIKTGETLVIDLNDMYSFGPSAMEEAFGGLIRYLAKEHPNNISEYAKLIEVRAHETYLGWAKEDMSDMIKWATWKGNKKWIGN